MVRLLVNLGCALVVLLAGFCAQAAPKPKEQSVSFTAKDGWVLSAVYLPADGQGHAVILLHDLGKSKNSFASFEKALAKEGIGYVAVDLRGHGQSAQPEEYKKFAKEGADNPFNKMTQDVQAAVEFLQSKGVSLDQIFLLGTGLGANVAAKTVGLLPELGGIALISPNVNIRDVLVVPALKLYKGYVLIAASAGDRKGFLEASILRNVAFLSTGEGKVTFLTAYDFTGHELLDKYITQSVVQWLQTPHKPEVLPDTPRGEPVAIATDTAGIQILPSGTEEALVPSVLAE